MDGDSLGETDRLIEGLIEGLTLNDSLILGETLKLGEIEGLTDGETDGLILGL